MRPMWRGAVSFGLVNIPVRLYAATENKDPSFRLLHARCRTPIRYAKVCPTCEIEVPADEVVKGYEFQKGQYVLVDPADFPAQAEPTPRAITITEFVQLADIDPIFFDRTYYLEPDEGAAKAYHLLREALAETARIAIAQALLRSRPSLACVRVYGPILALETMHYPDEIRSIDGLSVPPAPAASEQEKRMAAALIEHMSTAFDPAKHTDAYREGVLEQIQAKIAADEAVTAPPAAAPGKVIDLMAALEASLQAAQKKGSKP
ncbi:MAG TPA: Ku protein, partial [Limnochordia bacterium]